MINFFSSALQKLKKEDESNIKEEDQAIDSIAKLFIDATNSRSKVDCVDPSKKMISLG